MAHSTQVVEVRIIKGGRVGEAAELVVRRFEGEPRVPLTDDDKRAALNDAVERAIAYLARHLDYGAVEPEVPRRVEQ